MTDSTTDRLARIIERQQDRIEKLEAELMRLSAEKARPQYPLWLDPPTEWAKPWWQLDPYIPGRITYGDGTTGGSGSNDITLTVDSTSANSVDLSAYDLGKKVQ